MSWSQPPSGRHSFRRALHSPLPPDIQDMLCDSASPSVSSTLEESKEDFEDEGFEVAASSRRPMHIDQVNVGSEQDFEELNLAQNTLQDPSGLLALELSPAGDNDESTLEDSTFSDSLWSHRAADASTSWDVTQRDDSLDLPVPLLSRDGKWRGNLVVQSSGSDVTLDDEPRQLLEESAEQHIRQSRESTGAFLPLPASPLASSSETAAKRGQKRRASVSRATDSNDAVTSLFQHQDRSEDRQPGPNRGERSPTFLVNEPSSSGSSGRALSSRYALRSRTYLPIQGNEEHSGVHWQEILSPPEPVDQSRNEDTHFEPVGSSSRRTLRSNTRRPTVQEDVRTRPHQRPQSFHEPRTRAQLPTFAARQDASDKLDVIRHLRPKTIRSFPTGFPFHRGFPLFYQRYYVSTCVDETQLQILLPEGDAGRDDPELKDIVEKVANQDPGFLNETKSLLDLYTPRIVRGAGLRKEGMCPICFEDDSKRFFSMKNSAYNYHLQNAHGISASTCLPFTPPIGFTTERRPRAKPKERTEMIRGLCHVCNRYVDLQGPRDVEVKVPEIYWWKHAQSCHRAHGPPQEANGFFMPNAWFERICALLDRTIGYEGEIAKLLSS